MSARPDVPRLAGEDLDLLISRSLDGDLSPEEEQQLERLVALDPLAARRRGELAALVARVKELPEPAAPFALATRVNANVAERGGRPGSVGGRVGFFPAPGFAKAALVVLGIVGASIAIFRPAPKRMAEGPVDVFLYDPQQPASPAPQSVLAEARPASRLDDRARRQETDEKRNEAPPEESAGRKGGESEKKSDESGKQSAAKILQPSGNAPAAADSPVVLADAVSKEKSDREEGVALGGAVGHETGRLAAAAPEAVAPAPAAPPPPAARAMKAQAPARGWTVSVRGDGASRWALRRAPDSYPVPASNQPVVFRVSLDASGRVASLRAVGAGAGGTGLDEFVRGMIFEPLPQAAGGARDKLEKDAQARATTEIEIELAPR